MALLAWAAIVALAGCEQQKQPTELVTERPPEEGRADHEAEGEAAHDHEGEAPPEATAELPPDAAAAPEDSLQGLQMEVDYDRSYSTTELDRLRGVLMVGTDEQKQQAQATLKDLLLNSRVGQVRQQAAAVLGSMPAGAEDALAQVAESDPESGVREMAIASLARAPLSDRLISLLQRLQDSGDAAVRSAALGAEMTVRLAKGNRDTMLTADWVARMLGRRRDDATAQLQMQLVPIGEKVLPVVIEVLQTAEDPVARAAAACTVGLICAGTSPQQQEFARLAMDVKKASIPESQPAILAGVAPLEHALQTDPDYRVRATAAQGLGYLGQDSSAPLLGEALHDSEEEVRWWAALALEGVPGLAALDDLAYAATKDESDRVREAAVRALGWIHDEGALLPLVRATADTSSGVRQAAAAELGHFVQPAASEALVQLFDDPNEDVRWAAVLSVGNMRNREAAPALTQAMRDPSPMVANAAERALQRMGIAERRFGTKEEPGGDWE